MQYVQSNLIAQRGRIKTIMNNINALQNKMKKTELEYPEDLESIRSSVFSLGYELSMCMEEVVNCFYRDRENNYSYDAKMQVEMMRSCAKDLFNQSKEGTIEECLLTLKVLNNGFDGLLKNLEYVSFNRTVNSYYNTYVEQKPTTNALLANIIQSAKADREITYLDVSGLDYSVIRYMRSREVLSNAKTYAIISEEGYYRYFQERGYDRIAIGRGAGTNISNEAFDIVYCYPVITGYMPNAAMSLTMAVEKIAVKNMMKFIRPGGLGVIALPYYRFSRDLLFAICKQLRDVKVMKVQDHAYVFGIKKEKKEKETISISSLCEQLLAPDNYDIEVESFDLPKEQLHISSFRGSVVSESELLDAFESTTLLTSFLSTQIEKEEDKVAPRPLIPFTSGQIGLVLTSGSLDGVVDEENGFFHAVRGRVIKKTTQETSFDSEGGEANVSTISSNQVEISLFTPSGDYRVLY